MTDKLKCCFCGSEFDIMKGISDSVLGCPKCKHIATIGVWEALIDGKKTQDALKVARNLYQELALAHCEMVDDYRTAYGCLKTPEQETQEYMKEYDEKITSITKQE